MLMLGLTALACVPPDCTRPDCGTCGVACCALTLSFPSTNTTSLMSMLNSSLAKGGPDSELLALDPGTSGIQTLPSLIPLPTGRETLRSAYRHLRSQTDSFYARQRRMTTGSEICAPITPIL